MAVRFWLLTQENQVIIINTSPLGEGACDIGYATFVRHHFDIEVGLYYDFGRKRLSPLQGMYK